MGANLFSIPQAGGAEKLERMRKEARARLDEAVLQRRIAAMAMSRRSPEEGPGQARGGAPKAGEEGR